MVQLAATASLVAVKVFPFDPEAFASLLFCLHQSKAAGGRFGLSLSHQGCLPPVHHPAQALLTAFSLQGSSAPDHLLPSET